MKSIIYSATVLLIANLTACSSNTPYTGEKVDRAMLGSGVSVTQLESRSVLPSGGLAGQEGLIIDSTASVQKIDKTTRALSLKATDGKVFDITAGPEVRNFSQIKIGDSVRVSYIEVVEFEARPPTAQELEQAAKDQVVAARSPKGEHPAGLVAAGAVRILKVDSIDQQNGRIALNDSGRIVTVQAKYPQNLKLLHVGDPIVVKVAELVAADIVPAN